MAILSHVTLYSVLDVDPDVSPDDLKSAYRKRAAAVHPDRNPNDPEATRLLTKVNEAYQVLADDGRRKLYDVFGIDSLSAGFDAETEGRRRAVIDIVEQKVNDEGGIDLVGEFLVGPGDASRGTVREVILLEVVACLAVVRRAGSTFPARPAAVQASSMCPCSIVAHIVPAWVAFMCNVGCSVRNAVATAVCGAGHSFTGVAFVRDLAQSLCLESKGA
jgi:hypothetical protein